MSKCQICEQEGLQVRSYSRTMLHKGITITADGLQCDYCPACDLEMTSPKQIDHNAEVIRRAFIAERARIKKEQGLLAGAEIRRVRESLGITQKQASKIFGGGPTAFAKYEAEDVVQSAGMDKLIRLAAEVPAAAAWLFERAGETFATSSVENQLYFSIHEIFKNPVESYKDKYWIWSMHDAYKNTVVQKSPKLPKWFTEDVATRHGQFDLNNAVFSSCNDGAYADAA